jgi:hypothetical protein
MAAMANAVREPPSRSDGRLFLAILSDWHAGTSPGIAGLAHDPPPPRPTLIGRQRVEPVAKPSGDDRSLAHSDRLARRSAMISATGRFVPFAEPSGNECFLCTPAVIPASSSRGSNPPKQSRARKRLGFGLRSLAVVAKPEPKTRREKLARLAEIEASLVSSNPKTVAVISKGLTEIEARLEKLTAE